MRINREARDQFGTAAASNSNGNNSGGIRGSLQPRNASKIHTLRTRQAKKRAVCTKIQHTRPNRRIVQAHHTTHILPAESDEVVVPGSLHGLRGIGDDAHPGNSSGSRYSRTFARRARGATGAAQMFDGTGSVVQ